MIANFRRIVENTDCVIIQFLKHLENEKSEPVIRGELWHEGRRERREQKEKSYYD